MKLILTLLSNQSTSPSLPSLTSRNSRKHAHKSRLNAKNKPANQPGRKVLVCVYIEEQIRVGAGGEKLAGHKKVCVHPSSPLLVSPACDATPPSREFV